jgi:hypothetical protein
MIKKTLRRVSIAAVDDEGGIYALVLLVFCIVGVVLLPVVVVVVVVAADYEQNAQIDFRLLTVAA